MVSVFCIPSNTYQLLDFYFIKYRSFIMYFQLYQAGLLGGMWRWRLRASNHLIIADSAEGYHNREDCLHGIQLVMGTSINTPIR
jgi:uncharacterized protein YegP (UPF0339 family)